jgi:hypothetical protein
MKTAVFWRAFTAVSIKDVSMDQAHEDILRIPEDGDSTFSEMSVRASATRYQVYEDIFNWHRRENSPEDSGLPTLIVSFYGEAK